MTSVANGSFQYENSKDAIPAGVSKQQNLPIGLDKKVPNPGLPRQNLAPSSETPKPQSTGKQSVLQAHCAYWDADNDGIIYPLDTYHGFHNIGFNFVLSIIAVLVIHGNFSYWTCPGWLPDPQFRIFLNKVKRCKHGSDSESYNTEGGFVPEKFEEVFSKYSASRKDALNPSEIFTMLKGNRNILDPIGWSAAALEWYALWWVAADKDSYITKERARASFDGSLWPILAEEQKAKKAKQAQQKRTKSH